MLTPQLIYSAIASSLWVTLPPNCSGITNGSPLWMPSLGTVWKLGLHFALGCFQLCCELSARFFLPWP